MPEVRFLSIPGLVPFAEGTRLQVELVQSRIRGEIPDTVLFLEHAPVITRGRGLQAPAGASGGEPPGRAPDPRELPPGVELVETNRGGDLTYHGPGQLVIYAIRLLENRDVTAHLRALERALVATLWRAGIAGRVREGATGVWVGDHKIASIGIAVRRWVTYHGAALNCVNHLAPFHLFSPCGFPPSVMTRLKDVLPAESPLTGADWRPGVEKLFAEAWTAEIGASRRASPREITR